VTDELSHLNLRDDFAEAGTAPEATRWQLEMSGELEVLVTLAPGRQSAEKFQARLHWTRYPDCAPSLKFRDPKTGRLDMPQAWPVARGFRPQSLDACVNWCAEGLAIHPEWKNDPRFQWNPSGNPLLWVLRQLQEELDEYYQGRFK
jgi:hypothetical protein